MIIDWMKKIRITLALLFFSGISLLLTGLVPGAFRWLGWMPKLQFLPAVMGLSILAIAIVLALTILFGRIYCSTICPLGVMQDGISHVSVLAKRARNNRRPFRFRKELKWLRYGIWLLFVLALVFGLQSAVAVLAPYSAYGRIVSSIVHFRPGAVLIAAVATLLLTGILAWFTGREYCNVICPVGTTLSFFSRFAIFRPVIDMQKCKNCKVCENNCKAGCIDIANHKIDYSRCVDCFDCIGNCRFDALHLKNYYRKSASGKSEEASSFETAATLGTLRGRGPSLAMGGVERSETVEKEEPSSAVSGRRAFIAGAAMGLTAVALGAQNKKKDGGYAAVEDKLALERETPLTPPGSASIKDFYRRCTACQLCIAACPNGVLRPSSSLEHLMQPEMGFEKGYCRPECTKCSEVCPSGAIIAITREEKTQYHVGSANIDRGLCVAEQGTKCGNCARHCPTGAIQMVQSPDGYMVPSVDAAVCIGCGACENLCPSRPVSAITVNGRHNHLNS